MGGAPAAPFCRFAPLSIINRLYQPAKNLSRGGGQTALEGRRCRTSSLRSGQHGAGCDDPPGWERCAGAAAAPRRAYQASIEAVNKHLAQYLAENVSVRAIALLILDGSS